MKTPAQIIAEHHALGGLTLYEDFVSEIQRDAREGTVAIESIKPIMDAIAVIVEDGHTSPATSALYNQLRAKHPNLFTK